MSAFGQTGHYADIAEWPSLTRSRRTSRDAFGGNAIVQGNPPLALGRTPNDALRAHRVNCSHHLVVERSGQGGAQMKSQLRKSMLAGTIAISGIITLPVL